MALIKCKECKTEVSDKAKACPKCGAPVPKKTSLFTWMVLFFVCFPILLMIVTPKKTLTPEEQAAQDARDKARKEAAAIETAKNTLIYKAKEVIRASAKDPDSVEFRNVVAVKTREVTVVCGEFNARNSFGGMAGYQHFISLGSLQTTTIESKGSFFVKDWNKYCSAK